VKSRKEMAELLIKVLGLSLFFYALSEYNFLVGHVTVEGWSIAVAWSIYCFGKASYAYSRNTMLLILGYAYLVIGALDFLHALTYEGMNLLPFGGSGVTTQFWVSARYIEAFSLLGALLCRNRRLSARGIPLFYYTLFLLAFGTIVLKPIFTPCYIPGVGLTPFKIFSEYIIVALLGWALALVLLRRKDIREIQLLPFVGALVFTIAAEFCFTLYESVFAWVNMMGHVFKGISFYCLFRGVLVAGLFNPYRKMEESRDATFRLLHNIPIPLWQSDKEGTRFFWNHAWISLLGGTPESSEEGASTNLSWEERVHPEDFERYSRVYADAVARKKTFSLSYRIRDDKGRWRTLIDTAVPLWEEGEEGFWGISYDLTPLQEAHERVKSKEKEWRSLAGNLPDGLFRISSEGRLLFVNARGMEMFSVSRAIFVLGKLLRETKLPPSFRALEEEYLQPYFQGVRDLPEDPVSLRNQGRYYEARLVPEENERREPEGVLCIVQDVTARFLGEYERERLLRSMHRFSTILENTSDFVCIINSRGEIEYVNKSGLQLLQWRALGYPRRLEDIYSSSEVSSLLRESSALLEGMFIHPRQRYLRSMEGEEIPVSQVMVPIHMEGQPSRFGILARDIREQRRFEKELSYQKNLLQRLVDSIPMGIFLKDPSQEFRYVFWNSRMEEITGIPKEEILGERDSEHFQPDVAKHLKEQDEEVLRRGKPLIREEVRLFREEREHLIRLVKLPLLDPEESRDLRLVLGVMEDITEEKNMEAQLFQAQKMEAVGRLAGGIAHDLNNMLQIIHGYAELLMHNPPEEREKIEFFGSSIYNGCHRAREFIEQLLVFHRKGTYRLERISINSLVREMAEMLGHVMPEGIDITFTPGGNLPDLLADPGQIRQVVMNLCVNARDVLGESGQIWISTALFPGEKLREKIAPEVLGEQYLLLSVRDNGPGMSKEVRERVFEPFYSTKERGKGNGLGLSIVYAVATRHRGYVEVESEPGKGSLFSIYLPCGEEKDLVLGELSSEVKGSGKTEKPGKAFREAPVSGEQQKYATVLFAEDDEVVREFSREMLLSLGYRVIVAKNGREAVNLFSLLRDRIDALVFDVMMPEMNGLDAYRAIAAMGSPPPVLFCTAFMDTGLPEDFKGREDVWILKKPFGVEDFREKMEELFPESGQQGDMG